MKTVQEVVNGPAISPYTGSESTYALVAKQIGARWGQDEVRKYDPYTNTLTFTRWLSLGYRVNKGEKALRSITFIEVKDRHGKIIKKYPRSVFLFYYKQVSKTHQVS